MGLNLFLKSQSTHSAFLWLMMLQRSFSSSKAWGTLMNDAAWDLSRAPENNIAVWKQLLWWEVESSGQEATMPRSVDLSKSTDKEKKGRAEKVGVQKLERCFEMSKEEAKVRKSAWRIQMTLLCFIVCPGKLHIDSNIPGFYISVMFSGGHGRIYLTQSENITKSSKIYYIMLLSWYFVNVARGMYKLDYEGSENDWTKQSTRCLHYKVSKRSL